MTDFVKYSHSSPVSSLSVLSGWGADRPSVIVGQRRAGPATACDGSR